MAHYGEKRLLRCGARTNLSETRPGGRRVSARSFQIRLPSSRIGRYRARSPAASLTEGVLEAAFKSCVFLGLSNNIARLSAWNCVFSRISRHDTRLKLPRDLPE